MSEQYLLLYLKENLYIFLWFFFGKTIQLKQLSGWGIRLVCWNYSVCTGNDLLPRVERGKFGEGLMYHSVLCDIATETQIISPLRSLCVTLKNHKFPEK
jgi:hypothetical protein